MRLHSGINRSVSGKDLVVHPSVDVDVLDRLKRQVRSYQTRINRLLREAVEGKRWRGL